MCGGVAVSLLSVHLKCLNPFHALQWTYPTGMRYRFPQELFCVAVSDD